MKKIKLFLLIAGLGLSTVSLTSCNSDDSSDPVESLATVEGKWYTYKEGISANGVENLQTYQHTAGCTKDHVELVAGGVFKDREYWGTGCELDELTGTWTKTGNNMVVTVDGIASDVEIVYLTATEMKVRSLETMNGQTFYDVTVFTRN